MNNPTYDIIIIGAGVTGCAIARELSRYKLSTIVLEKSGDVAEGISKANSGVLHAGFNVKTNSLKAIFNVEGLKYFPQLTEQLDVPYRLTKKLVIAKNDSELPYLEQLLDQGKKNHCAGLSIIGEDQFKSIQAGVEGKYALYSERTGIISPYEFTIALAENAFENGVPFSFYSEVSSIRKDQSFFTVTTTNQAHYRSQWVINAAGAHADQIANLIEKDYPWQIYPVRGEYLILDCDNGNLLQTAVYPVPPKDGRGLGIHLTPTINGNILIGPSADPILSRNDVSNTTPVMQTLKKEAIELMPALKNIPVIKSYSGIRPKLFKVGSESNFADFIIEESSEVPNLIHLVGIESPGLTSAPAIAQHVVESLLSKRIPLIPKPDFISTRKGILRTKQLSTPELAALAKKDPHYAEIICRCEHITKAEILQAIRNPLGCRTLNAIKKRTHAMMGRCQGSFCLPKIAEILTKEIGLKPHEIVKNSRASQVLTGYHHEDL